MFYKTSTQKQKAYDFYNSYKGDKVTRPTFYYRVRLGWEEIWEEKIKKKIGYTRKNTAPKWKRAIEMTWYNEQPEPKASKSLFRNRLSLWYSKEEAILMWEAWFSARNKRVAKKPQQPKAYVPKRTVQKEPSEEDYLIKVTYPSEVAKVFRKEYQKMIEEIEWELTYTEEKTQIAELNSKLERLYKERETFNQYNPR